jgi:hypothetical protein
MRRQVMDAMIVAATLLAATQIYGNAMSRRAVRPGYGAAPPAAALVAVGRPIPQPVTASRPSRDAVVRVAAASRPRPAERVGSIVAGSRHTARD